MGVGLRGCRHPLTLLITLSLSGEHTWAITSSWICLCSAKHPRTMPLSKTHPSGPAPHFPPCTPRVADGRRDAHLHLDRPFPGWKDAGGQQSGGGPGLGTFSFGHDPWATPPASGTPGCNCAPWASAAAWAPALAGAAATTIRSLRTY